MQEVFPPAYAPLAMAGLLPVDLPWIPGWSRYAMDDEDAPAGGRLPARAFIPNMNAKVRKALNQIGGEQLPASGGDWLEKIDPASRADVICVLAASSSVDVERACEAARGALPDWAYLPPSLREARASAALAALDDRREELVEALVRDLGISPPEAREEVLLTLAACRRWVALSPGERCRSAAGESGPPRVFALVSAWDLPVSSAVLEIVRILCSGHACLWHPSRYAPGIAEPVLAAFASGGIDTALLGLLHGEDEQLSHDLLASPQIDRLIAPAGLVDGESCERQDALVQRSRPASVALIGPGSPAVESARALAQVVLQRSGQIRENPRSVAIHEERASEVTDLLAEEFESARERGAGGGEAPPAPLISAEALEAADCYARLALEEGAAIAAGGQPSRAQHLRHGFHFEPTLFVNVGPQMSVWRGTLGAPFLSVASYRDRSHLFEILTAGAFDCALIPANAGEDPPGDLPLTPGGVAANLAGETIVDA